MGELCHPVAWPDLHLQGVLTPPYFWWDISYSPTYSETGIELLYFTQHF